MRAIFFLILIVLGVGALFYYKDARVREKIRDFQVSDDDRQRHDNYEMGKALLIAAWEGSPTATFEAWGDDEGETSGQIPASDLWVARGHLSTGSGERQQWCMAFDPKTGKAAGKPGVGKVAEQVLAKVDALAKNPSGATSAGAVLPLAGTPPPAGAWMWNKTNRGPLDQPAHKK